MPTNDEQPSAADFARMQEQVAGIAADIAEIKHDLRERAMSDGGRIDALVQALAQEREYRAENDNTLNLQIQQVEARLRGERQKEMSDMRAAHQELGNRIDALRLKFTLIGSAIGIAWGVVVVLANYTLRLFGH